MGEFETPRVEVAWEQTHVGAQARIDSFEFPPDRFAFRRSRARDSKVSLLAGYSRGFAKHCFYKIISKIRANLKRHNRVYIVSSKPRLIDQCEHA